MFKTIYEAQRLLNLLGWYTLLCYLIADNIVLSWMSLGIFLLNAVNFIWMFMLKIEGGD